MPGDFPVHRLLSKNGRDNTLKPSTAHPEVLHLQRVQGKKTATALKTKEDCCPHPLSPLVGSLVESGSKALIF